MKYIKRKILVSGAILCLFSAQSTQARPSYLTSWINTYAQDNPEASETNCQLCHQRASGGNGWNEYGWDLRVQFLELNGQGNTTQRILQSFNNVENFNSDPSDSNSNTYLEEVLANAQPGWREGSDNIIRFRNATDQTQAPPSDLPCGTLVDPNSSQEQFCTGVDNPQQSGIAQGDIQVDLQTIATGFSSPVLAVSEPTSPNSVYVVEQGGTVQKVNVNTGEKELFLDFSNELVNDFAGSGGFDERGLLGFAFDPDYENNNRIYTYISKNADGQADFSTLDPGQQANHQTVVSEWTVINPQSNPIAGSEREMLIIDQPQFNHNAGSVVFAPDGTLIISLGDGGGANDNQEGHGENGNGRDNTNPLGAILRIDPRGNNSDNGRYGIPADNPFVGQAGLDEIYAYGFRNPYRISVETLPGDDFNIYVGDVGQGDIEEVDIITRSDAGGNYGWNYKEGSFYFFINPNGSTFISETPPENEIIPPLIDPIAEYDHDEGISVIGGHVYTGSAISALSDVYVFGEWLNGRLFYLNEASEIREFDIVSDTNFFLTGFGVDNQNELYVVGSQSALANAGPGGTLMKLVDPNAVADQDQLCFPIRTQSGDFTLICL